MSEEKIQSYRDLIVWQKAKALTVLVYQLTEAFPHEDIYGIVSQMRRAALSLPSNIAEGQYRGTKKEFHRFLSIAFGSGAELETQLEIARDLGKLKDKEYRAITSLLDEVMRMLNVMLRKLKVTNE